MTNFKTQTGFLWLLFFPLSLALASESYSPYANHTYPSKVYFGDTHLHTNLSVDANSFGNKSLTIDDAYRFARGETVKAHNGMKVLLTRPLDFLVVADHANNVGLMNALNNDDTAMLSPKFVKRWRQTLEAAGDDLVKLNDLIYNPDFGMFSDNGTVRANPFRHSVWQNITSKADQYNEPNVFTAFIGYEWTPVRNSKGSRTLHHRVVIFRDGADKAEQLLPFSRFDSEDPADLWAYLQRYTEATEGEVIAIPHNSNMSRGEMFAITDAKGQPLTSAYAETRSRWEPLVEVTQIKGDSETHPLLSPTDEFSSYETWSYKTEDSKEEYQWRVGEYARSALKQGLQQQVKLGINPFKFGMIGSTDAHTSLATGDENNFWGKMTVDEPSTSRTDAEKWIGWYMNATGYAAVWAQENTRRSLFAAMKRKEVYATTGPRITVRFFGGWDYQLDDAFKPDLARIGYKKSVPMGGDLTHAPDNQSPRFLIRAVKDPDGANLDRVQVIKGWHDKDGELHEKIYNVALSDARKENLRGKVKPVGNTVDVKNASYTNSIGDPELAVVWIDPNFNQDELAFYYVRVLEIPTPRWTTYDTKFFELKNLPDDVPMITQERAYTSPIWYSPKPKD